MSKPQEPDRGREVEEGVTETPRILEQCPRCGESADGLWASDSCDSCGWSWAVAAKDAWWACRKHGIDPENLDRELTGYIDDCARAEGQAAELQASVTALKEALRISSRRVHDQTCYRESEFGDCTEPECVEARAVLGKEAQDA